MDKLERPYKIIEIKEGSSFHFEQSDYLSDRGNELWIADTSYYIGYKQHWVDILYRGAKAYVSIVFELIDGELIVNNQYITVGGNKITTADKAYTVIVKEIKAAIQANTDDVFLNECRKVSMYNRIVDQHNKVKQVDKELDELAKCAANEYQNLITMRNQYEEVYKIAVDWYNKE